MARVLVIACSARKKSSRRAMPAIERYDGPAFRVLRKYLREQPGADLRILILSAKFGLIPATKRIPNYELRLQADAAKRLRPQVINSARRSIRWRVCQAVGVCAGKDYQAALAGLANLVPAGVRLEKIGGGLGQRLTALKHWLRTKVGN